MLGLPGLHGTTGERANRFRLYDDGAH